MTISISCYIQILTSVAVEYGCVKIMRNNLLQYSVTNVSFAKEQFDGTVGFENSVLLIVQSFVDTSPSRNLRID